MNGLIPKLGWLAAAAACAYACSAGLVHASTPVDRALPFVAVVVTAIACASLRPYVVQCAVPLLLFANALFAAETTRLLAYGVIVAAAFAFALSAARSYAAIALAAIALLRWFPFDGVIVWRELVVLAGSACVYAALLIRGADAEPRDGRSLGNVAVTVLVAAVTQIIPLKALAYPFVIALLVAFAPGWLAAAVFAIALPFVRYSWIAMLAVGVLAFVPLRVKWLPAAAIAMLLVALFPWSGVAVHTIPTHCATHEMVKTLTTARSLARTHTVDYDVEPATRAAVIVSASNLSAAKEATLGTIEGLDAWNDVVARAPVTLRDAADWGFMRREHFFASRNRVPRNPSWRIIGYGASSWLYGAGRVELRSTRPIARVRITADPSLPPAARLQVDAIETPLP